MIKAERELESEEDSILVYFLCAGGGILLGLTLGFILAGIFIWVKKDIVRGKEFKVKEKIREKDYQVLKGKDQMGGKENNVINSKHGNTTAKILLDNYGENNAKF